jgi:hypothetical protein
LFKVVFVGVPLLYAAPNLQQPVCVEPCTVKLAGNLEAFSLKRFPEKLMELFGLASLTTGGENERFLARSKKNR